MLLLSEIEKHPAGSFPLCEIAVGRWFDDASFLAKILAHVCVCGIVTVEFLDAYQISSLFTDVFRVRSVFPDAWKDGTQTGMDAVKLISVPLPGVEIILRFAPIPSALSRIPTKPVLPVGELVSKPLPLSETVRKIV